MFIRASMIGSHTCCHRRWHLKSTDFITAFVLHKSLHQWDNVHVSSIYEQITSLCSNWTSGSGSLQVFLFLENTHITPLLQCWDCNEGSIEKLFLCAVWHITSASHPTHCRIISLSPQRWVVPWRQTAVMNLHNCLPPSQLLWKWGPCSEGKQK